MAQPGGIPALMKELAPLLHLDRVGVAGIVETDEMYFLHSMKGSRRVGETDRTRFRKLGWECWRLTWASPPQPLVGNRYSAVSKEIFATNGCS